MGVGSGGQGCRGSFLDFQTWYKYSRGLKVLFFVFFSIFFANFRSFFPLPPPLGKFPASYGTVVHQLPFK